MGGAGVDQETMLHHLEELAEKLGIDVRYEAAAGRVGMGRIRDRRVAVIDANLRVNDRVAALSTILAGEEINGVYVPPAVRVRIDRSNPLRVRPEDSASEEADTATVMEGAPGDAAAEDIETGDSEPSEGEENCDGADPDEADAEN